MPWDFTGVESKSDEPTYRFPNNSELAEDCDDGKALNLSMFHEPIS